jgi:hypothetical protein
MKASATGAFFCIQSKAFSARPVYLLRIAKSRPEIAVDLCHGKKDAYKIANLLSKFLVFVYD